MIDVENLNLIKGDCLIEMQRLIGEGVKVDMVLTDPPYGTTACKWDNVIDFGAMWRCIRGLRNDNTPVVLFGSEPFSSMLRCSNLKEFKYDWIWDKRKVTGFLNSKKQPLRAYENICVFYNKQPTYNPIMTKRKHDRDFSNMIMKPHTDNYGKQKEYKSTIGKDAEGYPTNVIRIRGLVNNEKEKVPHPTQKPVALLEYLIKTYTNEGDTVLDFTMGSGSTAIACMNTNRKFIGIELDDKYFEIAQQRVNEHKQEKLF